MSKIRDMRKLANLGRLHLIKEDPKADITLSEVVQFITWSDDTYKTELMHIRGASQQINELIINAYSAGYAAGLENASN